MGPTCSTVLWGPPWRGTVWDSGAWFEITIVTGPAPTLLGSTETDLSVITPDSCSGIGGLALSLKSLPPPQPGTPRTTKPPTKSRATRRRRPDFLTLPPPIPGVITFPNQTPLPPPDGPFTPVPIRFPKTHPPQWT